MEPDYRKNIAAYRRLNPQLADFVDQQDTKGYEVRTASSQQKSLYVLDRSGTEIEIDGQDPEREIYNLIPLGRSAESMFILSGIGLGYLLFACVKAYPHARILVIEHDARVFKTALQNFDFTPYFNNPRIEFLVGVDRAYLQAHFIQYFNRNDNSNYLPIAESICNDRIAAYSGAYYPQAMAIFNQSVEYYWRAIVTNSSEDMLTGLRQTLVNLPAFEKMSALSVYENAFAGKRGVLVMSGPSLDGQFDRIREAAQRAVLICADSMLRILLENGIKPFGVVCLERHDKVPQLFQGYEIPDDIVLFATPEISPAIVLNYPGPVVPVFRPTLPFTLLPQLQPRTYVGMSCAHLGYFILGYLGCIEVATLGQDLAYERVAGHTHVDGIAAYAREDDAKQDHLMVPDNQGGEIATNIYWVTFRDVFTRMIQFYRYPLKHVIQASQGLKIIGAERMDPEEYARQILGEPVGMLRFDPLPGRIWMRQRYSAFLKELEQRIQIVCQDAVRFIQGLSDLAVVNQSQYLEVQKKRFTQLQEPTRAMLEELLQPMTKRFDVGVQCLWNEREFNEYRSLHLQKIHDVMMQFLHIVQEAEHWFQQKNGRAIPVSLELE